MKLITRDTDYALRAICCIVQKKGKRVSSLELRKTLQVPRPYLRKILQALTQKGVLSSYKGLGGGFVLMLAADKIYLLDLMRIFQGKLQLNECTLNKKACPNMKKCPLRAKITGIEEYVFKQLRGVTIASLLR